MYLVKSLNAYFGTNAERVAAGLSSFLAGDEFNETDTGNVYQHNGMAWIKTAVDGSGYLPLSGGTLTGGLVVNSSEGDNDFRIAGNGVTNGVYYDAGNSRFGINTIPSVAFHVVEDSGTVAIFEENASGEVGINSFYNPNTTDNNGSLIRFDTDTTGTGATARSQIAQIGVIFTTHNHATRTGNIVFRNFQSGAFATRMTISAGVTVGAPTGGDKGAGTINAVAVYDDNTLLTDFVFEDDYQLLSIKEMEKFFTENKHLPTIPGRKVWESEGKFSLGKLANYLWETIEVQAIYISQLNDRLTALEGLN